MIYLYSRWSKIKNSWL